MWEKSEMMKYNPNKQPNSDEWFCLDEIERMDLVTDYHKKIRAKLPNIKLHATFHVIVENQLAEGIPKVVEAFCRLTAEGLDRHDAIHAIGSVLTNHMFNLLRGELSTNDPNDSYFRDLSFLTKDSWMNSGS
jgi:hypothetical protein